MKENQLVVDLDKVIQLAVKTGVETALSTINREKHTRLREKHDKRLRNTRLLLKEYRNFVAHSSESVYKSSNVKPIDILDELEEDVLSGELCVESIKTSTERTRVIVEHINSMLAILQYLCHNSGRPEQIRRYNVLYDMYISSNVTNAEDIAKKYHIDRRTVYRDIDTIAPDLTVLMFGVDGIRT